MTFDSSGVTFDGTKREFLIDESTIYFESRYEPVDQLPRKVIFANYEVHPDSLMLKFENVTVESSGDITLNASATLELAERPVHRV
jgi:hypothetical protein